MQVYLGIDWSEKRHALVFLNEKGAEIARETIGHTPAGFARLDQVRHQLGVAPTACLVGIESAHSLLVDWLWGHGYDQIYVVAPSVTRSRQGTYRQSGARTDHHDAYLIANLLRTDRHLLSLWSPPSALIQQLRVQISLRLQLLSERVRKQNQLREVLMRYYPALLAAFSLDTDVALAFLVRYPTPQAAAELRWRGFMEFAQAQGYAPQHRPRAFAALQAAYPQALPAVVAAYHPSAMLMAQRLAQTRQALKQTATCIQSLYQQHPDTWIYDSLPGVGQALAPALLSKLGDDRQRFPHAGALQALAGTAPVTDQSGKRRRIYFRTACDHEFRTLVQQWARCSVTRSPWAAGYWAAAIDRGHAKSRAYRGLANRWLAILWKLWQTEQAYDEDYHLQQVRQRSRPRR